MKRKSKVLSISVSPDTFKKFEDVRKSSSRSELIRNLIDLKYREEQHSSGDKGTQLLASKIKSKEALVSVIGLGYVGLPLAVSSAKSGFRVTGYDKNKSIVKKLNEGVSHVVDTESETLRKYIGANKFFATDNPAILRESDVISICVPTPLNRFKQPDISYIQSAAEDIAKNLRAGQLIILESTTYPGTTEEVVLPLLEQSGLKVGRDIFLAFSPERIDPGNKQFEFEDIPKVVGGVTKECTRLTALYYSQFMKKVVKVSNPKSAELSKLLENIFRIVNVSMINEMALLADKMGIDIWEVIDAASTKPYGFMPFYPSAGVGGHCIPLDPFYLSYKAREYNFHPRFIELSGEINDQMPHFVLTKIIYAMNTYGKALKGSKILIVGVAYKKDINDTRDSASLKVFEEVSKKHAEVAYYDPFVPEINLDGRKYQSIDLTPKILKDTDCAVILTDHTNVDYEKITKHISIVVDTRNVIKSGNFKKVYRL